MLICCMYVDTAISTYIYLINCVVNHISEEYEMDKSLVTQLAKLYHKQNVSEVKAKADTVVDEYESIFGG